MSTFYLDSSALVKRYLTEIGSAWVRTLTSPVAGHTITLAEITQVEVAAALAARHRAGGLAPGQSFGGHILVRSVVGAGRLEHLPGDA